MVECPMAYLTHSLNASSSRKLLAPIIPAVAQTPRRTTPHPSPLDGKTDRAVVITTVLATVLAQRGFTHGGINE